MIKRAQVEDAATLAGLPIQMWEDHEPDLLPERIMNDTVFKEGLMYG